MGRIYRERRSGNPAQNPIRRITEIFGHICDRDAPAFESCGGAEAVAGFDQQRLTAAGIAGAFDILDAVTDHDSLGRVDPVLAARFSEQTRQRFTAGASFFRPVRAEKDVRDAPARRGDVGPQSPVHVQQGFQSQYAAVDCRLVGEDDKGESGGRQPPQGHQTPR